MTGAWLIRIALGVVGVLLMLAGVGVTAGAAGIPGSLINGLSLFIPGAVLVVVAAIEVNRYRSEAAEGSTLSPGPGGGESGPVEPRFEPTSEVFVDPTSNRRMRVLVDPRTGERRYQAEG